MGMRDLLIEEQAIQAIEAVWSQHLRPAPVESISEWADKFRQIAKGPEKGLWRTSRTPYLREPMECMSEGSPVDRVVMQFATQLGKTEVLYNTILQRIHRSPMDMMIVQPTLTDSKDHSRERFMPTVRRMPEIASRMAKPTSRDESATWQTKTLAGGATLFFAGANSARSLASKPLGLVCCDEIDGYPMDVDGEGDPLTIIGERMSNFSNRKMLLCSTPTVRDVSRIETEYLASDRRRYNVPCPHCARLQVLEWGSATEWGLKWLRDADGAPRVETVAYICRHCGGAISEHSKTAMLAEGLWIADAPGAQGGTVAGFQLSKLYSPIGWRSWVWMVREWDKAQNMARQGDTTKLKAFVNTSLAETWEEQGDRADEHALRKRADASDSRLREVHPRCFVCTRAVDVQGDRLEAYTWAWGRGMERQLVDRAVFYGDPAAPESDTGSPWAALTAYRAEPVTNAAGVTVPVLATFIDSGGHHTHAVYVYCRQHHGAKVHAVKGASQAGKPIFGMTPTAVDINWRGQKIKKGVKLWQIGTDTAKAEVYGRLRVEAPGPGYVHLPADVPTEVLEQLTSERLVTRYVKGRARLEWVKPNGKRNEALDCAVYALAAAHYVGMERWKPADWARWERRLVPEPATTPPGDASPAPVAAAAPPAPAAAAKPAPVPRRRVRGSIGPGRQRW